MYKKCHVTANSVVNELAMYFLVVYIMHFRQLSPDEIADAYAELRGSSNKYDSYGNRIPTAGSSSAQPSFLIPSQGGRLPVGVRDDGDEDEYNDDDDLEFPHQATSGTMGSLMYNYGPGSRYS